MRVDGATLYAQGLCMGDMIDVLPVQSVGSRYCGCIEPGEPRAAAADAVRPRHAEVVFYTRARVRDSTPGTRTRDNKPGRAGPPAPEHLDEEMGSHQSQRNFISNVALNQFTRADLRANSH
ncbi:hypothetical protein EVAR_73972_1 [Eumeta japonica]|uniref:Uncharacterized protein n=1 Tax=Eumeta variegata TaxID=151549 RepID=A0A4C1SU35_EUMVA|nr:hypothetical protein EVAR_73972_1 [Eumeta japonica]